MNDTCLPRVHACVIPCHATPHYSWEALMMLLVPIPLSSINIYPHFGPLQWIPQGLLWRRMVNIQCSIHMTVLCFPFSYFFTSPNWLWPHEYLPPYCIDPPCRIHDGWLCMFGALTRHPDMAIPCEARWHVPQSNSVSCGWTGLPRVAHLF